MSTFVKVLDVLSRRVAIINTDKVIRIRPAYDYMDRWEIQLEDEYAVYISDHEFEILSKLVNVVDCSTEPTPVTPKNDNDPDNDYEDDDYEDDILDDSVFDDDLAEYDEEQRAADRIHPDYLDAYNALTAKKGNLE